MSYQTFDPAKPGASQSELKFSKLAINRMGGLEGKTVLDIGCNEGYFCSRALELGAIRVVGVDRSAKVIRSAIERVPDAEFRQGTWWDLPDESFDVIFFLSALHYEERPKALFSYLKRHLNPGGVIILECGLAEARNGLTAWKQVYRNDILPRRYATSDYMTEHVLSEFSVVSRGRSVDQKGDPISRWVLHCYHRQPMVMIVTGQSGAGKSIFTGSFAKEGVPTYRSDALFSRMVSDPHYDKNPLALELRKSEHWDSASALAAYIVENQKQNIFAETVCDEAATEAEVSIIEGQAFAHPEILDATRNLLEQRGIRVWLTRR